MCNHKWTGDKRKEMLLWVETCQHCGSLRYGWKFGKSIEYTYAEQSVQSDTCYCCREKGGCEEACSCWQKLTEEARR